MRAVTLRPLTFEDLPAAARLGAEVVPGPPGEDDRARRAWLERRLGHQLTTDPDGAWAAEEDGTLTGVAVAILRDGLWGLTFLGVRPGLHGRGTGGRLLEAALSHGDGGPGALIVSSADPRAMRLYARAGFDLRPCVAAGGILDASAIPGGLRARPSEDVEQASELSAPVRGGAYAPDDLALLLTRERSGLLLVPGRGFAIHAEGSPLVLAAETAGVATDLLWSCLAAAPRGGTVAVDALTAGQDWAVKVALAARLALTPEGPLFTRGILGPLRPWIPSGAIL